ncbi:MAG: COX15/CtaA family protein [Gammaproteobacteria bacterium]|nr:COX15/CtaA family protein [Gammaproteobacteria bacterium]
MTIHDNHQRRRLGIWLSVCCVMIFCMVVLGGVTRLTQSGLSMVEWSPIMGVIPPLSAEQWEATFEKYQQFPEYQHINKDMDMDGFKRIFWVEYTHRILGRLIGFVFLVPFLLFLLTRKIDRGLLPKLVFLFVLGALQGLLGWYMVKSGLVNEPHVSQYRLTAHLILAVFIYVFMLWVILDLFTDHRLPLIDRPVAGLKVYGVLVTGAIALMIISGGFVAGTKAGFVFNTFPTMNGQWVPDGVWALTPGWRNLFENVVTVQFTHRSVAAVLCILIPVFCLAVLRRGGGGRVQAGALLLLLMLVMQVGLGIVTLLYRVPVLLGAAHQAGALLLISASVFTTHALFRASRSAKHHGMRLSDSMA